MTDPTQPIKRCRWEPDDDGIYNTSCGQAFVFNDDGPVENGMRFCCYCGSPLQAKALYRRSAMRKVEP